MDTILCDLVVQYLGRECNNIRSIIVNTLQNVVSVKSPEH